MSKIYFLKYLIHKTNYKEHDFVSIVEHTAIKRIEAEERYKQHLAEIEEMHRKRLERNSEKPERKKDIAR